MQEKKSNNVKFILERAKEILYLRTDLELADFLGIAQNTISGWKSRNTMDYDLFITKLDNSNINFHWLFTGNGNKYTNLDNLNSYDTCNNDNSNIIYEDVKTYKTKIEELELELKKTGCEIHKDTKELARLENEISMLRAKLEFANNVIDKLIYSQKT